MTECARCGDCCEHPHLPRGAMTMFREAVEADSFLDWLPDNIATAKFVVEHWSTVEDDPLTGSEHRCDAFDTETRLCTAHDDRPPICRLYPWYHREPDARTIKSNRCSFWADVPRELRPSNARPLLPLAVRAT